MTVMIFIWPGCVQPRIGAYIRAIKMELKGRRKASDRHGTVARRGTADASERIQAENDNRNLVAL
jgi:hypothetical protein